MRTLFIAANILIAIDYALIGWFFFRRLWLPVKKWRSKAFRATVALALFFVLCVHTHIDLAVLETNDAHWHDWWNVMSHWVQGLAGFVFWRLAKNHLVINIFDKKTYSLAANNDTEARLQYLAARVGLVK